MSEVREKQLVALQLCYDVEENTLSVGLVVGVDVYIEPLPPSAHVLTCIAQRVDHLFPRDDPRKTDLSDRSLGGFAVCDPGGILALHSYECLKVVVKGLMEGRGSESEELRKVVSRKKKK